MSIIYIFVIVCVLFCHDVFSIVTECTRRGRFGLLCNRRCSRGCFQDRCHRRTGSCIDGCKNNLLTGVNCSECVSGSYRYFGFVCLKCSDNCKAGTTCNNRTGSCNEGCKSGWHGNRCDKRSIQCQKGTYLVSSRGNGGFHQTCIKCPTNCKLGTSCNSTTGICDHGCQNGWAGDRCSRRVMQCKNGYFVTGIPLFTSGRFHRVCRKCPTNCKIGTTCNKTTGNCDHGCKNGWAGDKCNKRVMQCKNGYFVTSIPLFTSGRFRRVCRKCPTNCKIGTTCNNTTGNCDHGCKNGWAGDRCNRRVCKDGTYMRRNWIGLLCVKCPPNCKAGSTCNRNTGTCDGGCSPFWSGDRCNKAITTTRKTTPASVSVVVRSTIGRRQPRRKLRTTKTITTNTSRKTTPASASVVLRSTIGRRQPRRKMRTTKTITNDTRNQLDTTTIPHHISSKASLTMISTPLILKSVELQKNGDTNRNGFIIPLAVVSSILGIVILLVIIHFGPKYFSKPKAFRNQTSRDPPVQCSAEITGGISTIQLDNYFASDLSTKELASHYYLRERETDAYYYPSDIQELVNYDYLEESHRVDTSMEEVASRDNTRNKHQSFIDDDYESVHFYENPEKQIWQDKTRAKSK